MISKLCIGTVQFGIPYGVNNSTGIPSESDIQEILKNAYQAGINYIDTAKAYGESEKKIGKLSDKKFKIISKFSSVTNAEDLNKELSTTLENLKTGAIYGYIAHNADTLISYPELWKTLIIAKENKLIEKIGFSLYTIKQLENLLEFKIIPDLVQLPYSLLDTKFVSYLPKLKALGVEIHVRSVFLQGLYFMNPNDLPKKLKSLESNLQTLKNCCDDFNISIGALALNFAITNSYIDKVVIGVDTNSQLQQNIEIIKSWKYNQQLIDCISNIEVANKELLNPTNW